MYAELKTAIQQDFDRYFYIFKKARIRRVSKMEIEKFLGGVFRENLLNWIRFANNTWLVMKQIKRNSIKEEQIWITGMT